MTRSRSRWIPGLLAAAALAACSHAARSSASAVSPVGGARAGMSPAERAAADSGRPPYSPADVHFMSGMIDHHAQAVLIAGWAPSHGASPTLQSLCERIVVAQRDEIVLMQRWLRDRHETVPDGDPSHHMMMPGMDHPMLMPGMLNDEQLARLDRSRGVAFDSLFLTYMILHHQGAITMVDALFGSNGAAQDEIIYKFASDVYADQTTEIERMNRMLTALPSGGR